MQSNGIMKSSALVLDVTVSAASAFCVLDQERHSKAKKSIPFLSSQHCTEQRQ